MPLKKTLLRAYLLFVVLFAPDARAQSVENRWTEKMTLELVDTDVGTALQIIAEATGVNIVLAKGVHGRIRNLRLQDVTAEQLFQLILRLHNLYAEREGNIVIVYPISDYIEQSRKK